MVSEESNKTITNIGDVGESLIPAPEDEKQSTPEGVVSFWREAMYDEATSPERKEELAEKEEWPEGFSPLALRGVRHAISTAIREWGMSRSEILTCVGRRWGHSELYHQDTYGKPANPRVLELAEDYEKVLAYLRQTGEL